MREERILKLIMGAVVVTVIAMFAAMTAMTSCEPVITISPVVIFLLKQLVLPLVIGLFAIYALGSKYQLTAMSKIALKIILFGFIAWNFCKVGGLSFLFEGIGFKGINLGFSFGSVSDAAKLFANDISNTLFETIKL